MRRLLCWLIGHKWTCLGAYRERPARTYCVRCSSTWRAAATFESERAALVAEVGECCMGRDPLCAGGCLVQQAIRKRSAQTPVRQTRLPAKDKQS